MNITVRTTIIRILSFKGYQRFGCLDLPLPKAHRVFTANIPDFLGVDLATAYFVAMDYIAEPTLEACWGSLDKASRESMT